MPSMSGCRTYDTMCGKGSVIQECSTHAPIRRWDHWQPWTGFGVPYGAEYQDPRSNCKALLA
eukprot:scaffold184116_cov21-Tisochrysis_lutea.AAC.2